MKRNTLRRGQSLAEYALILGLVAVVVIVIAFGIGLADQRIFGGGAVSSQRPPELPDSYTSVWTVPFPLSR